jgi:hypothetical protein
MKIGVILGVLIGVVVLGVAIVAVLTLSTSGHTGNIYGGHFKPGCLHYPHADYTIYCDTDDNNGTGNQCLNIESYIFCANSDQNNGRSGGQLQPQYHQYYR